MNRFSRLQKHPYLLACMTGVVCGAAELLAGPENPLVRQLNAPNIAAGLSRLHGGEADAFLVGVQLAAILASGLMFLLGNTLCMSLPYRLIQRMCSLTPQQKTGLFWGVTLALQGGVTYLFWHYKGFGDTSGVSKLLTEGLTSFCMTAIYLIVVQKRLLLSVCCGMMSMAVLMGGHGLNALPVLHAKIHAAQLEQSAAAR